MTALATLTAEVRVRELLRTLDDARVAWEAGAAGGGASIMPSMYLEGSYAELERVMVRLRDDSSTRRLWWHAVMRYRAGEVRTLTVPVRERRLGPEPVLPARAELIAGGPIVGSGKAQVRVYVWSELVDQDVADDGVRALASGMHGGRSERIRLPRVYIYRLLGLAMPAERAA